MNKFPTPISYHCDDYLIEEQKDEIIKWLNNNCESEWNWSIKFSNDDCKFYEYLTFESQADKENFELWYTLRFR